MALTAYARGARPLFIVAVSLLCVQQSSQSRWEPGGKEEVTTLLEAQRAFAEFQSTTNHIPSAEKVQPLLEEVEALATTEMSTSLSEHVRAAVVYCKSLRALADQAEADYDEHEASVQAIQKHQLVAQHHAARVRGLALHDAHVAEWRRTMESLVALEEGSARAKAQAEKLETALVTKRQKRQHASAVMGPARQSAVQVQARASEKELEISHMREQYDEELARLNGCESRSNVLRTQRRSFEEDLSGVERTIYDLHESIAALMREKTMRERSRSTVQEELANITKMLESFSAVQRELTEAQRTTESASATLARFIAEAQPHVDVELQGDVHSLATLQASFEAALKRRRSELMLPQKDPQEFEAEILRLNGQLDPKEAQAGRLRAKIAYLDLELVALGPQETASAARAADLEQQLQGLVSELEKLNAEYGAQQSALERSASDLDTVERQLHAAEKERSAAHYEAQRSSADAALMRQRLIDNGPLVYQAMEEKKQIQEATQALEDEFQRLAARERAARAAAQRSEESFSLDAVPRCDGAMHVASSLEEKIANLEDLQRAAQQQGRSQ
eukprot:NODE_502_length_2171_cov_23.988690_g460_i0.p1 GENE.NODE_502_length_2171_cov_23.988690_g460_i0~~NODE_502_length_2171_cov_23.988690_g460_i0.p1  ORF type:complete len:565 (+),score=161.25 NODE_502_length_2171_cov_23.988690_g460_i0:202-1896(+)